MPRDRDFVSFFALGDGVLHRKAVSGVGILTGKKSVARGLARGDGNRSN